MITYSGKRASFLPQKREHCLQLDNSFVFLHIICGMVFSQQILQNRRFLSQIHRIGVFSVDVLKLPMHLPFSRNCGIQLRILVDMCKTGDVSSQVTGCLSLKYPGILDWRKWRPKEEMGGNGRAREGERETEGE